jgi:hypothetical protein
VRSCATVGAALVIAGRSLTATIATVCACTAQPSGTPPSHTWIASWHVAAGVGPAAVNVSTPVEPTIAPPQVCPGASDQPPGPA